MADRYCRNCGHELGSDDQFCANCGRPVHQTAHVPTPEADVPVPPPPQPTGGTAPPQAGASTQEQAGAQTQGRSTASKLLIGCAALLVLPVLLVGCLALLTGGGGDQANSPPERGEKDEGVEGGGRDPEADQPLQGEEAKPREQPEPAPEAAPHPRPITLSGYGPEATRPFQLEDGLTVIEMRHQGNANFIVDLLDENGNSVAPMGVANVIGPFQGSMAVQIQRSGQYLLDVQNAGQWQIIVKQPRAASAPEKTSFSGNSAQATQLFELSGGLHRVEMTHQGDANFIVDLLDENGASVVPMGLVNEIGPFEGSRAMQVPDDGIYLFSVEANGPWTIQID